MGIRKSEEFIIAENDESRPSSVPPRTWALARKIANIQKPTWFAGKTVTQNPDYTKIPIDNPASNID